MGRRYLRTEKMLFTRTHLETQEDQYLAPYACRSRHSKGRAFLEEEDDHKTSFQRDCDRILHTKAYDCLGYKTHIFYNFRGESLRTLLSHGLEVAHIGRSIARALGANGDLVEAICLARDLGFCAFGHVGEASLSRIMRDYGGWIFQV